MAETLAGLRRSHYCGEVSSELIGSPVTVYGWVQRRRDLGGILFVDLRDRTGLVQLAFDSETPQEVFEKGMTVRSEFVLAAVGTVRARSSVNEKLKNGDVEVQVKELRILAKAKTPPFEIGEDSSVKEELRLKYRYLDLRRPPMQRNLILRHRIVKTARDYFDRNGFLEIETPVLIKSTPEGARDYLVPSRLREGCFYALPQSPQLYKQLLMLSGYDRYMQIARCFRDEDLRADRQPEFTQIDLEMSFVEEEDVMSVNEGFVQKVFRDVLGAEIPLPFPRMTWHRAMELYGSDKPDTRFGMTLIDLTGQAAGCGFGVFAAAARQGGGVRAIRAEGAYGALSRKEIDKLTEFVKGYGARGLAWTRISPEGVPASSFEKFLSPEEVSALHEAAGLKPGDVLLAVADADGGTVFSALGALRIHVAEKLGLIPEDKFNFLWVTEFPLFEYSKEEGRFTAMHHPFTAPFAEDADKVETDKAGCRARAYDMVLNGVELGGGSIRINDPELQQKMFSALGFTREEAERRFGFLMEAFQYGAPPHGGMAYGLDRLVMLMLRCDSIREVIAFPKVQNASELMTACPDRVDEAQLRELHLRIDGPSQQ